MSTGHDPETGKFNADNSGRPPSYREEFVEQAYRLCLLGLTDRELAAFFEVNEATVWRWRSAHPQFGDAIRRGKDEADAGVAEKLYRRACGYSHDAVKIFMPQGAKEPVYANYVEHYPPDTQAASFWLRNRQPKKWRDKLAITGGDEGDPPVEIVYRWEKPSGE